MPEQKLKVGGILEMSTLDYPGKVSSVIFLHGCNFRCPFCFNGGLVLGSDYKEMSAADIARKISGFRDFIDAVVITGGEPALQDIEGLCRLLKGISLLVKIDTNGTNPALVKKLVSQKLADFVAIDVKAPFSRYSDVVGVKLSEETTVKIKETYEFLISSGVDYECRCPVVPGVNLEMMETLAQDVKDAKVFALEQFWSEKGTLGNVVGSISREQLLEISNAFKNNIVKIRTRESGEEIIRKEKQR